MSLTQHTTKRIGWAYEVNQADEGEEGVSPITGSGVPYYEFGEAVKARGNFPNKEYFVHSYYSGSRDPNLRISHMQPKGAIGIALTNGIEFYNAFGKSVTNGSGIHTITGINSGKLPTRAIRFQSENASENIREELLGAKTKALNFEIFNTNARFRIPAMIGVGLQGVDVQSAAYDADYAAVFPGSTNDMYYVDDNFVFTWDEGGDDVDYSAELIDFQYICDMTNRFQPLLNQLNPKTVLDGFRAHILSFKILRGGDTSIYDDFVAQDRESTGKNLQLKIFNTPSNYIQLDFTGVFMPKNLMNDANDQSKESDEYQITAMATSCIPKIKDGLNKTTFYDEAA